jgi:hypothetical protein
MPIPDYKESRTKAVQQYDVAWHLLNVTLPLTNDPHLLIGIINNIFNSFKLAIDALIAYEQQLKAVPSCNDDFESKFNLFRLKVLHRHNISPEYPRLILELREILNLKKTCQTEFQRGNLLVLANKEFQMKTVDLPSIKKYLDQNKQFLGTVNQIISKTQQKDLNSVQYF